MMNWKFILFVCSLCIAYASAKIPEKCSNGPTFWCKNLTNAVDCKAYDHCFQSVWMTQKSELEDWCQPCEGEIESIRQFLGSNATKDAILEALEYGICESNILSRILRKECENLVMNYVDNNLNYLLDLLRSSLDAGQLCHLLGFCTFFTSPAIEPVTNEDALVHYKNIILHLPASFLNGKKETPLLGSQRCTWGPSYWCHNITSSAECKTTSHCISKVWKMNTYPEDNDSVCQICKDMVKQARDQLESNETQTELREVFEGSCKLIHIKEVVKECIKLADEFVPELTEILASEMNPTAVCTVAGLCNSQRIDKLLISQDSASLDSRLNDCVNCTAAVSGLERYLNEASANQVREKLERLCGQLSTYSESCLFILDKHFDEIYVALKSKITPFPVCHLSGMCSYRYHLHGSLVDTKIEDKANALLESARDDVPCDLCTQLVTHLKEILVANTTEDEFLATLKGMCRQTGKFKEECLEIVENNFEIIYRFLTDELNPKELCQEAGLCPRKNLVSDEGLQTIQAAVGLPFIPKTSECRFCKTVVDFIKSEMKKPEYEHDIEKAIKDVCYLPAINREKCNKFVDKYADELIKLLTDDVDSGTICAAIDLCHMSPSDKGLCKLCEDVLSYVEDTLNDPKTQQNIEKTVGTACSVLPKSVQADCHKFIKQYSMLIIDVLSEEVDPQIVCPLIKVCPGIAQPYRCNQCRNVVGSIVDGSPNNDRRAQFVEKHLQSLVSSAKRRTLNNTALVAAELKINHKNDLIDVLSAEFSADESCVFLNFCEPTMIPPPSRDEYGLASLASTIALDGKPSCKLCELMVKLYEERFLSNVSQKEIEQELLKFCDMIHNEEMKDNCSRFVDKNVPRLMELLKRDVKPEFVCELAKQCPYKAPKVSVATTEKCRTCEIIVGSLQGLAEDPSIIQDLLQEELKICDAPLVPADKKSLCRNIVSQLLPQLDQIAIGLPSWFYCSKIDMCPYGVGHKGDL